MSNYARGLFFAVSAYIVWGFLPMYWRLLVEINSFHILGFRILFSLLSVGLVLVISKNATWLKFYKEKHTRNCMIATSLLVTFNWGLYIWAVNSGYTIEASLGYYINPLISVALGLYFFKEKLNILQIIAFGLVITGVLILTILTGRLPWISISLGSTFAVYGMLKKAVNLTSLESLGVETLLAMPLGLLIIFTAFGAHGIQFPSTQHFSTYLNTLPRITLIILLFCGVATSLPLFLFASGARLLPLSTMGFIQLISPTISFLTGLFIFREPFPVRNFIAVGFIWAAAILYIISQRYTPKQK